MATKVIDPVCGMNIDPEKAVGSSKFNGETYYFCMRGCETKFDAEPERYAGAEPRKSNASCCGGGHHS